MVVLADFGLFLYVFLEFSVFVLVEEPFENSLLNFLVIIVLKELVREEFD